jgi:hypothetical protein
VKWILWALVSLITIVGVMALIGYFLPIGHEASRRAEFNKPPEVVYALISDLKNYPSWWPENEVSVEVVETVPPSKFVTRIVGESAFGGTWTWVIEQTAAGSRATITERGEIYNPIFRALARFVFGYTSSMESCLAAAQRRLRT